jgi:hypothetical protein
MKSFTNLLLLALSSSLSLCCSGFTLVRQPRSTAGPARHIKEHSSSSALRVSFAANAVEDETLYRQLLNNARACAFSDTSSPAEARRYLHDILHMESGCVAGTLVAHDVCDNVDETADIVVHLREKAAQQDAIDEKRTSMVQFIFPLLAAVGFMTVVAMIVASTTTTIDSGNDAVPLELQEWSLAARDGHLGTMIEHYFRNGGL